MIDTRFGSWPCRFPYTGASAETPGHEMCRTLYTGFKLCKYNYYLCYKWLPLHYSLMFQFPLTVMFGNTLYFGQGTTHTTSKEH